MGLRNIRFQQAGFLTFELEPAGIDLITAKYALHHLPDFWKGQALVRMAAALRPGGRLYIEDVAFPDDPADAPHVGEAWSAYMTTQTGYSRAEVAGHVRDEHSTFRWVLEGLIERAGFDLVSARHEDGVYGAWLAVKRQSV
jgi:ubiquinone/menaquinone biosynthesis C-methylase UbiE